MFPPTSELTARVRRLVEVFNTTGLVQLRITAENGDAVDVRRAKRPELAKTGDSAPTNGVVEPPARRPVDLIKADLVGIAHFSRPAPSEGQQIDGDRELAYVEALGIRTPVRSHGSGRIAGVLVAEGQPVEYGQPLFEIERA
ncbi:MAG: biotin/lipoyl-binding protein [Candidatus Eremiobacteraeota bacterium]|nr:biotin/lipoyl-binding protein [Candidatus Eremiobacteraeota bacterium]